MTEKEAAMLAAINAARTSRGLHALRHDDRLASAAYGHAVDLSRHPGLLHVGSDGSSIDERLRREGYAPTFWRECVGWGFQGEIWPMLDWWLASPEHAPIVLSSDAADIGVGYVYAPGAVWGYYWCVDFAAGGSPPAPRPHAAYVPGAWG